MTTRAGRYGLKKYLIFSHHTRFTIFIDFFPNKSMWMNPCFLTAYTDTISLAMWNATASVMSFHRGLLFSYGTLCENDSALCYLLFSRCFSTAAVLCNSQCHTPLPLGCMPLFEILEWISRAAAFSCHRLSANFTAGSNLLEVGRCKTEGLPDDWGDSAFIGNELLTGMLIFTINIATINTIRCLWTTGAQESVGGSVL